MISEIILMIRLAMGHYLLSTCPPQFKTHKVSAKYDPFPDMLEHIHQKEGGTTNGQVNPQNYISQSLGNSQTNAETSPNVTVFPNVLTKKFIFFFKNINTNSYPSRRLLGVQESSSFDDFDPLQQCQCQAFMGGGMSSYLFSKIPRVQYAIYF